jgi:hypothetical protein
MKPGTPTHPDKRDIMAVIAAGIADLVPHNERVEAVQGTLRVDEIEARLLISRGRRLARERSSKPIARSVEGGVG